MKYLVYINFILLTMVVLGASCESSFIEDTEEPYTFEISILEKDGWIEAARVVVLIHNIRQPIDSLVLFLDSAKLTTIMDPSDTLNVDFPTFADGAGHTLYGTIYYGEWKMTSAKIELQLVEFLEPDDSTYPNWTIYSQFNFGSISPVSVDENGFIWMGISNSFTRVKGLIILERSTGFVRYRYPLNSDVYPEGIVDIAVIEGGSAFVLGWQSVARYDYATDTFEPLLDWTNFPEDTLHFPGRGNHSSSVEMDADGDMWLGTYQGIAEYEILTGGAISLKRWTGYDRFMQFIHEIIIAENGDVWGGQNDLGTVWVQSDTVVLMHPGEKNMPTGDIDNMSEDKNGHIWVRGGDGNSHRFDGQTWQIYNSPGGAITPLYQSSDGTMYAQSDNRDVWQWDGNSWSRFGEFDSPFASSNASRPYIPLRGMTVTSDGTMLFVTSEGLFIYEP